jgi:hypothetical protein
MTVKQKVVGLKLKSASYTFAVVDFVDVWGGNPEGLLLRRIAENLHEWK